MLDFVRPNGSETARDSLDPSYQPATRSASSRESSRGRGVPGESFDKLNALFVITHDSKIVSMQVCIQPASTAEVQKMIPAPYQRKPSGKL